MKRTIEKSIDTNHTMLKLVEFYEEEMGEDLEHPDDSESGESDESSEDSDSEEDGA